MLCLQNYTPLWPPFHLLIIFLMSPFNGFIYLIKFSDSVLKMSKIRPFGKLLNDGYSFGLEIELEEDLATANHNFNCIIFCFMNF